jgi:hypothetical protein
MPMSLSPARVYCAWSAVAIIGLVGYLLYRRGQWLAGLLLLALYGALGLYGFLHDTLAPLSAHSWQMNATIWLEVGTATVLLTAVAQSITNRCRGLPRN